MVTDLFQADQRHVWHPFTQHAWWPTDDPLVISRADGVWLYDDQGRKYIDGFSSLWVTVHGHNEPAINEAIARQARTLDHSTFLGFTHEPGIRLAEELVARSPKPLSRVFFAGDGSSAVEAGIKMAYQAKLQQGEQRPLYVHVAEGLPRRHARRRVRRRDRPVPSHLRADPAAYPDGVVTGRAPTRADRTGRAAQVLDELRILLAEVGDQVCAIVIEPLVQAAGGMLTTTCPSFGVRALSTQFGAYLMVDEVATGIGRTGRMWAVEHADISPDLLTCGRA